MGDDPLELPTGSVALGGTPIHVSAGYEHTCALFDDGKVTCWGDNAYGQLGLGHTMKIGDNETPGSVDPVPM